MSDTAILIIIGVVVAIGIVVWLLYLAAGLVLMFMAFVAELPTIVAILMFILFPPTFIVFLVGLAFIQFGIVDASASSKSDQTADRKPNPWIDRVAADGVSKSNQATDSKPNPDRKHIEND